MTENCCQHKENLEDDFLLDGSAIKQECVRCRKNGNSWSNNDKTIITNQDCDIWLDGTHIMTQIQHINSLLPHDLESGISRSMDEHIDTLEDSPLLTNDFCRDSLEEFHCHDAFHSYEDRKSWTKLVMASLLCFLFMVTELVGGYIAGSLAVMTDAAHLFSDFIGFLISLLSMWIGRKPPTKNMTFGYQRAEVLGAFISVQTVWVLSAVFSVLAINRLWKKDYDIDANTMILVASLGLVINIVMGGILHGVCHTHGHGLQLDHSHSHVENINVKAAAAHVLGDLLQSVGVLISALIIKFEPSAKVADPLCTIIFSIIAIIATLKVARDSLLLLLEGNSTKSKDISLELKTIPGVQHVHSLHVWSLAPGKDAFAVHLAVDQYCNRDLVIKKANAIVKKRLNVVSCTIQVEVYNSELVNSCKHCRFISC